MPSQSTLYNDKGERIFEFGSAHRNTVSWSPHGRFMCIAGFGNLAGLDGNYVEKTSVKFNYRVGDLGVQLSSLRKGDFYQSSETRSDGTRYVIPSMTTINASVYYWFNIGDQKARVKFAVKNLEDERAPLADRFYGFFADAHQDYGRNFYLDIKVKF